MSRHSDPTDRCSFIVILHFFDTRRSLEKKLSRSTRIETTDVLYHSITLDDTGKFSPESLDVGCIGGIRTPVTYQSFQETQVIKPLSRPSSARFLTLRRLSSLSSGRASLWQILPLFLNRNTRLRPDTWLPALAFLFVRRKSGSLQGDS